LAGRFKKRGKESGIVVAVGLASAVQRAEKALPNGEPTVAVNGLEPALAEKVLLTGLGAVITALIGFAVYNYKNRITYSIVTIQAAFGVDGGRLVPDAKMSAFNLCCERLTLKNHGFRSLQKIVLHLSQRDVLLSASAKHTTSLSPDAVSFTQKDKVLEIAFDVLPSGEEIEIELVHNGWSGGRFDRLKGTGGSYVVWRDTTYQMYQSMWNIARTVGLMLFVYAAGRGLLG
jgi:hypothetical protein